MQSSPDQRLRDLLDAAPDSIIEVDQGGHILLLNRMTEKLFGYQRDELVGQPVVDELARAIGFMAEAVARRAGLPPDDFAARNLAGAITGVILSASLPMMSPTTSEPVDMFASIDAALAHLEAGLPL